MSATNPDRLLARRLAKELGITLECRRTRSTYQVDIYLPEGVCYDGNEGLDALHHEVELADADAIWAYVISDLRYCGDEG